MKNFTRHDLSWVSGEKKRYLRNLEEVTFLFKKLDKEAAKSNLLGDKLTRTDTIKAFHACKHVFQINSHTAQGRKRNWSKITWGSVIRLMDPAAKKRK